MNRYTIVNMGTIYDTAHKVIRNAIATARDEKNDMFTSKELICTLNGVMSLLDAIEDAAGKDEEE